VVENLSAARPDGTRMLEQRVVVPAPAQAVWDAWATTEGFRSWAAPVAGVDFRLGGAIEASYDFAAKLGDRDNIRNEIVAIVPGRMFAIRNVQAPAKVPFDATTFQTLHTVVFVEPRSGSETLVTIVMPGIGSGPAYDGVYKHFEWGNRYTLEQLRKRFIDGPVDWAKLAAEAKGKAAAGK
jgi:uncharacterized protein YndB with AHSA1/START domain